MTQVWPARGVAPVPALVSVICNPDAVVMGFPAVWAEALVETPIAAALLLAATAIAPSIFLRVKFRVMRSPWRFGVDLSSKTFLPTSVLDRAHESKTVEHFAAAGLIEWIAPA